MVPRRLGFALTSHRSHHVGPSIALLLALAIAACAGARVSNTPETLEPQSTSALEQWPPVSNVGEAPGVSIALRDRTAFLTNGSDRTYWLSPPTLEIWEGGAPWVVVVDPGTGVVEVQPGATVELTVPDRPDTVRIGARLWPTDSPDVSVEEPWFNWLEVPGNASGLGGTGPASTQP